MAKKFPDVNKDGKVTKKDVLMAKGVIPNPAKKLSAAAKKPGKLGQRARLAQTLKKLGK